MSQKQTQPKNSAAISKALAEHGKAKSAAELEKLKKLQNNQARADRLENRRQSLLPSSQTHSIAASSSPSTPKTPPFILPSHHIDNTRFTFNISPTIPIIANEPIEQDIREEPIKIRIDRADSDDDVNERTAN